MSSRKMSATAIMSAATCLANQLKFGDRPKIKSQLVHDVRITVKPAALNIILNSDFPAV
jgi:hypothetical protein